MTVYTLKVYTKKKVVIVTCKSQEECTQKYTELKAKYPGAHIDTSVNY